MDQETEIPGNEIPVGYPMEDIEILLLDDENRAVGPNEVGEIAVKSRYLSAGYWRRPVFTEAKFKANPDGSDNRLYLTGDLGLMLPDGCLFHRGRKDFRVKIRGYGVEIAEVESDLRDYDAINDGVVVARQSESGEARLVAYFTSSSQPRPSVSELRRFLKDKLPDYMVPSAFVMLDAMPLTPSGKVDRGALPDPKNSRPDLNTPPVAPRTSMEEKLVKIWAEKLRIDQIGVHDNFFDLGGHSLLAMRVISQVRDDFQVELSLNHFFETPTVAALAGYIETVRSPRDGAEVLSIQPALRDREPFPSFAQQSLWFMDQLEPGSPAYNLFSATELRGSLNVMALEQSFNEIIRRHEALRTVFKPVNGQPFQVILPTRTIALPIVDLRDISSPTEREAEIRHLSATEARRPFDLTRGPLLRPTLLRLTEETYVLFLTVHHIVFDAWSRELLDQELSAIYEAFSSGQPTVLQALPIQYADFAQWQRQRLSDKVLEEQLAYWKKQLENLSVLKLPIDRRRPAVQTFRGARQSLTLPEDLVEGLKILGRHESVTLFMTLLAAYLTLLHRYTGQNDIGIGSPISGRNRSDLESLIGFFLNMLVLRTDLSGNPTFRELLSRTRKVCLEAYANPDVPFERLVQELRPQRSLSHNSLFQATFALQHAPTCPIKLAGVTARDLDLGSGIANFDLHLFMIEDETTLNGWLVYNTDLFNADTIIRMTGHFQGLLEAVVSNPDQRLSELPMLTATERHQLLVEWNDTKKDYSKAECIHELFETQVEKTPDAVAVVFEGHQLSYRELNERANQVAHYLRKQGVGPEALVAICLERSLEMIIGLLSILKAGGAYLPLDPECPKERLAFMMEDTRAAVLLTEHRLMERLAEDSRPQSSIPSTSPLRTGLDPRIKAVCLDSDREAIAHENVENLSSGVTPGNLAYVMYTSGSTGKPKGVVITHHNVTRLFASTDAWFHFDRDDVWTLFHSYAFDFSVWEIWGALLHGGRLEIVPYWASRSPEQFYDLLRKRRVTVLNQTPSAFHQLMQVEQSFKQSQGITLRLIILGGEALDFQSLKPWFDRHGDQRPRLVNMYGITEATVHVTSRPIKALDVGEGLGSSIGVRIPDLELYVLDPKGNPAPIGVPGELHIGGAGLARGYINRSDLTAEKFIANPFNSESGARLYRSGDLARYLPDGNIEFLGRVDNQVKIRGYRIELGEVEAVLSLHPAVLEAVVVAQDDAPDRRLVAYVVHGRGSNISVSALRSFLKQKLPEYMIPSVFVMMDALPLTLNGKIDRSALASADQSRPELERPYIAPRTPTEELLAAIWAEVLKVENIGVHDNFFDLGGHSLLATQVISRVRTAYQTDVALRALFDMPTIAELANAIVAQKASSLDSSGLAGILEK